MGLMERGKGLWQSEPVSRVFGFDRGKPIDRHYIEGFIGQYATDIGGRVLEVGDRQYSNRFAGKKGAKVDVLHLQQQPGVTLVGDLVSGKGLPWDTFDCIIATQTLLVIYEVRSAVANLHRMLKAGGVLLTTFPGISQISRYDMDRWGDYWRFTSISARRLFEEAFPPDRVQVQTYGNVRAASAFLYGLAAEELSAEELNYHDPDYELLIGVRAQK
jgi:SAM-dependent methyltransferase